MRIPHLGRGLLIAILLALVSFTDVAHAAVTKQSIGIPMYAYPTIGTFWPDVNAAGSQVQWVIVNPATGPGVTVDPIYTNQIATNTSAGQRSIGYVNLNYQARPMSEVIDDIDDWYAMYPGISGIFFDLLLNGTSADVCYAAYAHNYVKSRHPNDLSVANFGSYTSPPYEPYADIFVNAENNASTYLSSWNLPTDGFQDNPAYSDRFMHIIHTASAGAQYTSVLNKIRNSNAEWAFITDDIMPNPYDVTPSYWSAELTDIATLPASTIPNRGITQLPAGCMDLSQSVSTSSSNPSDTAKVFSNTITLTNTSSTYTAYTPNRVQFTLPTGTRLTSGSGTNWSCSGSTCTYSGAIAPSSNSEVLSAQIEVDCDYTGGNATLTGTNFAGNAVNSTVNLSAPTDCALAATGADNLRGVLLGITAIGLGLLGITLAIARLPKKVTLSAK